MDLSELRLELVEHVLEHLEHQQKMLKPFNKMVLDSLMTTGPKTVAELEPYKPKLPQVAEVLQLVKQLETYVTTGKAA